MTLFAYGSLKDPKILRRLIDRIPAMRNALLRGYSLRRPPVKRWRKYWMATPKRGAIIRGRLLSGLTKREIARIHEWEETPENIWARKYVAVLAEGRPRRVLAYLGNLDIL